MPMVGAPFPDIADNVEKTPGVGLLQPYGSRLLSTVVFKPGVVGEVCGRVAEVELRGGSGATRVLPLCLARQFHQQAGD